MSKIECIMSVNVDKWAVGNPLPRDVKGKKNACRILMMASSGKSRWSRSAVLALAPILSGQRCHSHLPSTRAVRGVALNGWPDFIMPQSNPSKPPLHWLTPNLLFLSQSISCWLDRRPWVLRWSLVVSLSGEDFKMPENRNRALFVEIANIIYWVPIPDFSGFLGQVPPATRLCWK